MSTTSIRDSIFNLQKQVRNISCLVYSYNVPRIFPLKKKLKNKNKNIIKTSSSYH